MIIKNYINKNELETILKWAIEIYAPRTNVVFLPSGYEYRGRNTFLNVPEEIYKIKNRIVQDFDLLKFVNTLDIFTNEQKDNTLVKKHTHVKHQNGLDLRFNIMLRKSDSGGVPICDGKVMNVDESDLWIFNGNADHETDLVKGKSRYIISYGFIVEETIARKIIDNFLI